MYKAVIVGCGSIGALKPDKFDSPTTQNIMTHAHAIYDNKYIELMGVFDSDVEKEQKAAKKWHTSCWRGNGDPDILVIATPTNTHYDVICSMLSLMRPKIIIGEKPLGTSKLDCHRIIDRAGRIPIAVNYTRRYDIDHQNVASAMLKLGQSSSIYGCRVMYGRGLKHDGCHALDLMNWWFGRLTTSVCRHKVVEPNFKDDPSYGFMASYERCPQVVFCPVDSRMVGLFEIEIMTAIGTYSFISNGSKLFMRPVVSGNDWGDYPSLSDKGTTQKTRLTEVMKYVYSNVVTFLNGNGYLRCTSGDALAVWDVYEKITGGK